MEIKETIVDRFGRIVIPKKIREDFNLQAGTQVRFEESKQGIVIKPVYGQPNLHWKDGVLVFSGSAVGELSDALEKHRDETARSIMKP
ncbi:MAG: AbrB/MazE/SpoVT family DNA-binding domain-containing protein [Desulfobacterales bacterium]|jgi:AbrB family looped-hinge helix DNA binding protein